MKRRPQLDEAKAELSAKTDREWTARMSAALDGDEQAYRRLLDDIGKFAARVARKGLRGFSLPTHDVEDIVQETLLAVHASRARWRPEAGVQAWVATIARYKTIDAMRLRFSHQTTSIDDVPDLAAPVPESPCARLDVRRLMICLRPRQRTFVTDVMLLGCTVAEVAQRLEMTAGAGRVTLHRALREMSAIVAAPAPQSLAPRAGKPPARPRTRGVSAPLAPGLSR